ncbi:unnamed protein product [Cochlearia groenlandica]
MSEDNHNRLWMDHITSWDYFSLNINIHQHLHDHNYTSHQEQEEQIINPNVSNYIKKETIECESYRSTSKAYVSRGHWRPFEDTKLKELVSIYGPQNWNLIAEKLQGRSGKSCRLRWFNQLDPRINRKAFSDEEEERLMQAHRVYGNKWAMIARLFPGRTDNSVKNHWHVVMARKFREQSSVYRRRKTMLPLKPLLINPNSLGLTNMVSNDQKQIMLPCLSGYDHHESSLMFGMLENQMLLGDYIEETQEATTTLELVNQTRICESINEEKKPQFFDFLGLGHDT